MQRRNPIFDIRQSFNGEPKWCQSKPWRSEWRGIELRRLFVSYRILYKDFYPIGYPTGRFERLEQLWGEAVREGVVR